MWLASDLQPRVVASTYRDRHGVHISNERVGAGRLQLAPALE
jgi:hypothetical protein